MYLLRFQFLTTFYFLDLFNQWRFQDSESGDSKF